MLGAVQSRTEETRVSGWVTQDKEGSYLGDLSSPKFVKVRPPIMTNYFLARSEKNGFLTDHVRLLATGEVTEEIVLRPFPKFGLSHVQIYFLIDALVAFLGSNRGCRPNGLPYRLRGKVRYFKEIKA